MHSISRANWTKNIEFLTVIKKRAPHKFTKSTINPYPWYFFSTYSCATNIRTDNNSFIVFHNLNECSRWLIELMTQNIRWFYNFRPEPTTKARNWWELLGGEYKKIKSKKLFYYQKTNTFVWWNYLQQQTWWP